MEATFPSLNAVPQWIEHRDQHVTLHVAPSSPAEHDLLFIAARLETTHSMVQQLLRPAMDTHPMVHVYLYETLDEASSGAESFDAESPKIRAVYRLDAPGPELESRLVALLLSLTWGPHAAQSALLVDGVLGYVAQQSRDGDANRVNEALSTYRKSGAHISLTDVLLRPVSMPQTLYAQAVTSFVTYLIDTYGEDRLGQFGRQATVDSAPALEAVYGKSLTTIEQEWAAAITESQRPLLGVSGFVRQIGAYVRPYWRRCVLIAVGILISAVYEVVLAFSFRILVDRAIVPHNGGILTVIVIVLALCFILASLASVGSVYLLAQVGSALLHDIRMAVFAHLQSLSPEFYGRAEVGDVVSRFSNDITAIEGGFIQVAPEALYSIFQAVPSLALLFFLDWQLTVITLAVFPVTMIGWRLFGSYATAASYAQKQDQARISSTVQENVGLQPIIKAFRLQPRVLGHFRRQSTQLERSTAHADFLGMLVGKTTLLGVILVQLVLVGAGTILAYHGQLSVGSLVAFVALFLNLGSAINHISRVVPELIRATGGAQRVHDLLEERPQVVDLPNAREPAPFAHEIRFQDVVFSYTGAQANLAQLSLSIEVGQSVAIVGPSGCGKSTVLSLLMRFHDPTSGTVTIDDVDLREISQDSLRAQMGVVFQESFLFNDTIRENIRLGRLDATDDEIEAAAKAAEVHDFIIGLPQGYDTVVGERGGHLSGGQRQRLAIARALLSDPQILVLDEATAALDPATETAIQSTLRRVTRGCTLVSVTHRLFSVIEADQIFVLDRGRLVERGRHEELLKQGGVYERLWTQQAGGTAGGSAVVDLIARLRVIPMFQNLDLAVLAELAGEVDREQYPSGATVFEAGDHGNKVYLVVHGQVEVIATGPTGENTRVAALRDDDYFGEISFYRDIPRATTIRTTSPSEFLTLNRGRILKCLLARQMEHCRREEYGTGETVVRQGDRGDTLYLIEHGEVEVVRAGQRHEEQRLAILRDGDYFGEMAFYRDEPRAATVRTLVPSVFLSLRRDEMLKTMNDVRALPDAEQALISWLMDRPKASVVEVAAQIGRDEATVQAMLHVLTMKGFAIERRDERGVGYTARVVRDGTTTFI